MADRRYERDRVRLQHVQADRRQKHAERVALEELLASGGPAYELWVDERRTAASDRGSLFSEASQPGFWRMHMAQQKKRARHRKIREARRAAQLAAGIQLRGRGRPRIHPDVQQQRLEQCAQRQRLKQQRSEQA